MHLWRDRLNRWLGPIAGRIGISPNTITTAALLASLGGAALLAGGRREPVLFPLASFVIGMAGLLDALDGAVARARGKASRFGDFLDHLFDRISDVAILVGWCAGAMVHPVITVAAVVAVMLNGYTGTQLEATFGGRSYGGTGRGEFVLAAFTLPLLQFTLVRVGFEAARMAGFTMAEWLTMAIAFFAAAGIVQRFLEARRLAGS